jgi:acyl-CoA reductase-like NAD-dependent aldehyde dehydrogenase
MASIQKAGRFAEATSSKVLFSDGWQSRSRTFDVVEPATGMSLAPVAQATPANAKQAAAQARAAQIDGPMPLMNRARR